MWTFLLTFICERKIFYSNLVPMNMDEIIFSAFEDNWYNSKKQGEREAFIQ